MHRGYKYRKYLVIFILPALFWLFTNSVINWHYHQLPSGIIIQHAHPYKKQSTENSPIQSHDHSSVELVLLDLVSNPLFLLTVFIVAVGQFLPFSNFKKNIYNLLPPLRKFYNIPDYHAPPVVGA